MSHIHESLTRALNGKHTARLPLDLDQPHRFVVFSDQHKGAGDTADEFRLCRPAYEAALSHYRSEEYTLVLVGDVEELWEQRFPEVRATHEGALLAEGHFPADRYHRIWGNHDDAWMNRRAVAKYLDPYMPTEAVHEAIRFQVTSGAETLGTLFLLHGHQGEVASDHLRWLARLVLPIYRIIQNLFGVGKTTPAKDWKLRGEHDKTLYDWATKQTALVLMAGHTHRPVWTSATHLQKLRAEVARLRDRGAPQAEIDAATEAVAARVASDPLTREMSPEERGPLGPVDAFEAATAEGAIPCYFNTGCCKFSDGDITGLELVDGELRLIKWRSKPQPSGPIVLERGSLADIFAEVRGDKPAHV